MSPSSIRSQPRSCSVPAVVHRDDGRVGVGHGGIVCSRHANRTVPPVEILTPRSLAEALELKAEHPDALPIQGGTDVMVALNFDRARPATVLNLNEVRGAARLVARGRRAAARRGPDLHGGDARRARGAAAGARRGVAHGRLAADPQPRHDRRQPRDRLARRRRRCRRCTSRARRSSASRCAGRAALPLGEFVTGVKRNALAPDELIAAVWVRPSRAAADVHEGRAAERDGDRRRARSRSRPATSCGRRSARPGPRPVLVTAPREEADTFAGARRGGRVADRRRPRQRRLPPPRAARCSTTRALERTLAA